MINKGSLSGLKRAWKETGVKRDHAGGCPVTHGGLYRILLLLRTLWWALHPGSGLRLKSMLSWCRLVCS